MTILYEVHDIDRFKNIGNFASYSRYVFAAGFELQGREEAKTDLGKEIFLLRIL